MIYFSSPKSTSSKKISTRWWLALLCSFILFQKNLLAQQKSLASPGEIPIPQINYVSINLGTGKVEISWDQIQPSNAVGFGIQHFIEGVNGSSSGSFEIFRVNNELPYFRMFDFEEVNDRSKGFNIFAFDATDDRGQHSDTHFTVFCELDVDSCDNSIIVKWKPYRVFDIYNKAKESNVQNYTVNILNPDLKPLSSFKVSEEPKYKFINAEEGKEYVFVVSAHRNTSTLPSYSNVKKIIFPKLNPYFIVGTSSVNYGNQIDVNFKVDENFNTGSYILYRSEKGQEKYVQVAELQKSSDGNVQYSDKKTELKEYMYKLVYKNTCNIEGKESIPINNVLLKGRSLSNSTHLSWNTFVHWNDGVDSIKLYRTLESGNSELVASFLNNETEYIDEIAKRGEMSGEICYQIKYISNPDSLNKVHTSISNTFCVSMLGEIFMPNAFTPDGNGQNEIIRPSLSIIPAKYIFSVYNRYGSKIFETNNISEGWDGRLSDGKKALEGTYIYFVKIENGAGKVLEKRGNFSVIYP